MRRAEVDAGELDDFVRRVEDELARAGRARRGPAMVVLRRPEPGAPPRMKVDVVLPAPQGGKPPEGFESGSLEAQPVAYTVHHGRADGLGGAEAVLADWVKMKSLRFCNEVRRIYLKRGKNPRKDVTEVQIPLHR